MGSASLNSTQKWCLTFQPGGAGKGITDALSGLVDIGLASRDIDPAEVKKGAYTIYVTKDAVVPTFNTGKPQRGRIT